jgi:hypothetical protein
MIVAQRNLTRLRRTSIVGTDRRPVVTSASATIRGNVQPASPDDVKTLPEGTRGLRSIVVYVPFTTELRIASDLSSVPSDAIVYAGRNWRVMQIQDYPDLLAHRRAVCVEEQPIGVQPGTPPPPPPPPPP